MISVAERVRKHREKKKADNLIRVEVWIKAGNQDKLRKFADKLK